MPLVNVPGAGVQNVPEEQATLYSPATNPRQYEQAIKNTLPYRWQPGVSANPGGKPKGQSPASVIREAVDVWEGVEAVLEIARKAPKWETRLNAWQELWDRGWGSIISQLHTVTEDGTAVSLQAQYLDALRERLGLPAPTTVDVAPTTPTDTVLATPTRKRGRPKGSVDKTARKARDR